MYFKLLNVTFLSEMFNKKGLIDLTRALHTSQGWKLTFFKIYQPLNVFTSLFLVFNQRCLTAITTKINTTRSTILNQFI